MAASYLLALVLLAQGSPSAPTAGGAGEAAGNLGGELSLARGRSAYARGFYGTAASELARASLAARDDPRPPLLLGRALLRLDRPAEAASALREALERASRGETGAPFPRALCQAELARALEAGGELEEAAGAYAAALGLGAPEPIVRVRWAAVLLRLGRLEEAETALRSAEAEGGEGEEVGRVRSRLEAARLRAEGRAEEAERLERAAEGRDRERAEREASVARARETVAGALAALRGGDPAAAREALAEAQSAGPRDASLMAHIGSLQASLGRGGEARRAFEASLGIDPAHPGALHGLGLLEVEEGRLLEGLDLLLAAARRDPDDWKVRDDLADVFLRLGRGDEAIGALQAALARNPLYLPGYDALAGIHMAFGEGRLAAFYRDRRDRLAAALGPDAAGERPDGAGPSDR